MPQLIPPVNKTDHAEGAASASVTLLEYGDFECPHCGAAYPVVKKLQQHFGSQLRLVFRHFPLSNAHPHAFAAALAAEAAARQDMFWPMHDIIFQHQDQLGDQAFLRFAQTLHLDMDRFKKDRHDPILADKVDADFESGVRSGVNGTPGFFLDGERYNGSYDYLSLKEAIAAQLAHAV